MFLYVVGNIGLMVGDAGSVFQYILRNPAHRLIEAPIAVALLGVPGGLTIAWLLARRGTGAFAAARTVLASGAALMLGAWMASPALSWDARHLAGPVLAAAPAAMASARAVWAAAGTPIRTWLVVAAGAYVFAPWFVYGPASVAAKVARASAYTTTPTGLYNPLISPGDSRRAISGMIRACGEPGGVWYLPEPLTALELRGPMIITHADFEPMEWITGTRYRGPGPVCAMLPRRFEANAKGPAIRASFVDLRTWRRAPVPESEYDVWIGR
jgi:hypothetical protein